ncbi:MAG TPA: S46 family peptidase [Bryobacteraceae bacterium]|nr:S46 family peptidase [Bryobacteraceae bacterium]
MKSLAVFLACILGVPLAADEGVWPFNQFPKEAINQKHKFDASIEFLDRLRLASVRIAGGSGAFVSASGLIVTNQHLIERCIPDVKIGFYAGSAAEERVCPGLDASVLLGIEDVTTKVKGTGKDTVSGAALQQRNSAIARLEKECAENSGNVCSVVRLFSGGRYDLYQYKKYGEVRLVFAPEKELAFFGRERDSITYLRYGLDVAFVRAYENGKPVATANFLKWSGEGVKEGDLVFATGNPAATNRVATAAQLTFYRDTSLPLTVARLQTRIQLLSTFAGQSEANLRAAEPLLNEFLTEYKLAAGKLIGLRDDRLVARKTAFEAKVRNAVQRDPKLGTDAGKVWDEIAKAHKEWTPYEKSYQVLESNAAPGSKLFRIARQTVRGEKVDAADGINDAIETLLLTQYLEELKLLGDKEAPVKAILAGKSPAQAAEALVKQRRSGDDSMLRFAQTIEEPAKKLRKRHDDLIQSLDTSALEKIAQYRFKLFGAADYPDATGTPRVEFGIVKGYTDRAGIATPYASTFSGLYYRKNNQGPYQVPQRWVDLKDALNQVVALDFVSTCDIGGGDYGGPVVNRAGELVGVTFDGNLESLPDNFLYTDEQARAVHVATQGIAEALEKIYKASRLLQELGVGPKG